MMTIPSHPTVHWCSLLINGRYVTFMPLHNRSKKLVGYINLEFPRQLVYARLQQVALDNVDTLWPIIAGAVVVLFLLIHFLATRPIERRVTRLASVASKEDDNNPKHLDLWRKERRKDEFDELIDAVAETGAASCVVSP